MTDSPEFKHNLSILSPFITKMVLVSTKKKLIWFTKNLNLVLFRIFFFIKSLELLQSLK